MITEKEIQKAIKAAKATWIFDDGDRGDGRLGLQIRMRDGGRPLTEWYAVSRRAGKRSTAKIGAYPSMTLGEARSIFREDYEPRIRTGEGPRKVAPKAVGTLAGLVEGYVADLRARGSRVADMVDAILGHALDDIGRDRLASSVTPADIVPHLAAIHNRGSEVQANTARAYLSACFAYGLKAEHDFTRKRTVASWGLTGNPMAAIPANSAVRRACDRFLTPAELRTFWLWLQGHRDKSRMASALLLRIATGQRSEEVLRITEATYEKAKAMVHWSETKNGLAHSIPLPRQAVDVLESLPANRHGLFFPHRDDPTRPALQTSMRQLVQVFLADNPSFAPFTPKDLRRTFKTLGGAAGIDRDMRDRLQNHVRGDVGSKFYDRYDYLPERRAAMDKWEAYLDRVIAGTVDDRGSNVVTLKTAAAA